MLKRISKLQALRVVSQIMFLISMPELFTLIFNQLKKAYSMAIKGNPGIISIWPELLAMVIIFIITIVLGRFFCGWLCTFGAMNDFIYIISKKVFRTKFKVREKVDSILKYLKYVILIFIIVAIWTNGSKSFDSYSPWDTFAQVYNISGAMTIHTGGFILLVIIAVGAVFIERFFCRYLCPLGAILVILSKARILKIKKFRDKCGPCRICTNNCSMGIKLYQMNKVSSGECINCFKCIDVCSRKNAQLNILGENVNPLLPSAITIAAFTGVNALGSIINDATIKNSANNTATSSSDINKPEQKKYKDGTYVGIGAGENADLKVSVTVSNGKISSVKILSANEPDGKEALKIIPKEIVDAQSANVDVISGATMTSGGIKMAVRDALSQAEVTSAATVSEDSNQEEYKDGTYTGVGEGKNPNLKVSVTVTVSNGKVSNIDVLSANEPNGEEALKIIPKEIIDEQSTDVDVVSGATMTSNGILMAVDDALSQAEINYNGQNKYKNGTYTGVGQGKNPGLIVSVTINNDKISSIEFEADNEPKGKEAFGIITKEIIDAQSTNVDTVSGATMTSNGIIMAVNDALNQAKINN
ncbi:MULTISPECIES: FMN-binding protein [unclassified Clostridium]|uniref:FMN-binding protein n=1 Tax=unclassified Clostridium TaxID=2614128 RepID=UPI0002977C4B|nr:MULTISPECIES: FMN-binding protein [unclassified Clostridium]EKQ51895.1 MAG: FMN-binding protein [Clostridium sp. Maddingley MBC34-26]